MAKIIIMPKLGFNMSEGKLMKWYKGEGDHVKKGEALFAVETDKTSIDIEATDDGVVRKLLAREGDRVAVTLPIAIIGEEKEDIGALLAERQVLPAGETAGSDGVQEPGKDALGEAVGGEAVGDGVAAAFDIIVIGGGPGGYVAAIKAAQMGKRVAIVEKSKFGGVCVNQGCIPTKTLLRSVEALKEVRASARYGVSGVDVSNARLDLPAIQRRKKGILAQLSEGIGGLLKKNGVTVIRGEGLLRDKNTVLVGDRSYSTDYVIIATGSEVSRLPVSVGSRMKVLTSAEILEAEAVPENIVIIGGGVIGIEIAYFLANAGSKVTVVEFLDRLLPMVDEDISAQTTALLLDLGVAVHTGARVIEITDDAVLFAKDGQEHSVSASAVLMAVGRRADSGGIDCERLGLATERDAIKTDASLRTSVDNIYAIGDVNGKVMLAHTASMEGIVAVENICGHARTMDYDKIPNAVYIQPEIASVGLTEAQAREKYGAVQVGKFPAFANGKAKIAGEENGFIKVIVEPKYNEIVGVHLFCIHATDMIAEAVVAMNLEGTAEEVALSIHPHPTVSEMYSEAFHAALSQAIHI